MTLQLAVLKIPVTKLDRSVRFYETALGLKAAFMAEEFGWAQLEGAGVPLALYVPGKGGGDRPVGGSLDFHLGSPALDDLLAAVKTVAPDAALHENADGSRSLEFSDPDGNLVKIMG